MMFRRDSFTTRFGGLRWRSPAETCSCSTTRRPLTRKPPPAPTPIGRVSTTSCSPVYAASVSASKFNYNLQKYYDNEYIKKALARSGGLPHRQLYQELRAIQHEPQ